jgi:hypothetical protein
VLSSYLQGSLGGDDGCLLDVQQHIHRCLCRIRGLHENGEDSLIDREVDTQTLGCSGRKEGGRE